MNRGYKILITLMFFIGTCLSMNAQEKIITGTVVSGEGGPLPGVSVIIKGTNKGVSTDFDGNYTISANVGNVLVFSYVGMSAAEKTVGISDLIDVAMTSENTLEEVVIVGYGTTTKSSFTGTAKKIDGDDILKKNTSNISQALAGETAGVQVINTSGQPGSSSTVRIRGIGSVNGNRSPLYILDGIPFSGTLSSINPTDIESSTILKDASATAIYGARGANGVIVITTKRGKAGKGYIEIDTKTGVNNNILPTYETIKSPERYIELSWEGLKNRGASIASVTDPVGYANDYLFVPSRGIHPNYNMWNVADGGELIDPVTGKVRSGVTRKYTPENWADHAFQSSNRNETNLRIGGGNEKTTYYASAGYLKDVGYSINSDYKRYSTRLNLTHKVKEWLTGSFNVGYAYSETNNGGQTGDSDNVFWFTNNMPSIYPLFLRDSEGNLVSDPFFGGNQYDYGSGRGFGGLENSLANAIYGVSNKKSHELNLNGSFKIHLSDNLKLETTYGLQYYNSNRNKVVNPFYGVAKTVGGRLTKTNTELFSDNFLTLLRYNNKFNDHGISAFIAHENSSWRRSDFSARKSQLVNPFSLELDNAIVMEDASSDTDTYNIESYFSQVNYNYKNTYFLSGTVRRDGSSRFLNNKWGTFGSLGASWIITNENFMESQNLFDNLKFKASYGIIGEQGGVGYYPGYDLNVIGNLDGQPSLIFDTKGNPDLTWESSKMFQTGFEFGILKNRIEGSVDFYNKITDDLIFDRSVGPSNGYAILKVNDGKLKNQGIEIEFTGHLLKKEKAFIDVSINGEIIKNEMLVMPIEPSTGELKVIDINGIYGRSKGHSLFDFYVREWAGVDPDDGRAMWNVFYHDANNNGDIDRGEGINSLFEYTKLNPNNAISQTTTKDWSSATRKYIGKSAFPKIRGAFNLNTGYNNFELSAQFLYAIGGYAYDGNYAGLMHNDQPGANNWHVDMENRWQKAGDVTNVPRLSASYDENVNYPSTRFITKSDYLSLNNIRLGYNFPKQFLENIQISNIKLFVSGDNLWLRSKRKGFNPSTSVTGASSTYRYSPLSTFTIGLNVKF